MQTTTPDVSEARVNGITMAFDHAGSGADVVLFIHGHPFDRSMWRGNIGAVAEAGWRVVAPDLRGYGASTVVPGETGLDVFAGDLMALLDHLSVERAVVVGLSMGGQIAMECVRAHARRVRGLVLAATFASAETPDGRTARYRMAERLEREGMSGYADEVITSMLAAETIRSPPGVANDLLTMMRQAPPAGAAAALRGRAARPAYQDALARFDRPALVVAGSEDAFTTRAAADEMCALLVHSELIWMDGAGHMPNLERRDAFNSALVRFLARVSSATAPPQPAMKGSDS